MYKENIPVASDASDGQPTEQKEGMQEVKQMLNWQQHTTKQREKTVSLLFLKMQDRATLRSDLNDIMVMQEHLRVSCSFFLL